ncbi:hypothetical protein F7725_000573, partial [Dissostichus mawsoni]
QGEHCTLGLHSYITEGVQFAFKASKSPTEHGSMGSSMSCVPQNNLRYSSKSFIRRNSSRLFRKKHPQEGQEKSNSIINILCTVTPRKEMHYKDLQTIDNIKWDPPFPYDPVAGRRAASM